MRVVTYQRDGDTAIVWGEWERRLAPGISVFLTDEGERIILALDEIVSDEEISDWREFASFVIFALLVAIIGLAVALSV